MVEVWMAVGAGCIWHGLQILWVAPHRPSQFIADKRPLEPGTPAAFQRFWLDQYAWIGILLTLAGVGLIAWSSLS